MSSPNLTTAARYPLSKRGLSAWQKRPIYMAKKAFRDSKRDLTTYLYSKRDLSTRQKRPIYTAKKKKETWDEVSTISVNKRQKRPIYTAKEAAKCSKRDLSTRQKSKIDLPIGFRV
jgi:hypothetical protein